MKEVERGVGDRAVMEERKSVRGGGVSEREMEREGRGKEASGLLRVSALKREANSQSCGAAKVLNDFRRSCLASWFIRKSQFAQRPERERDR
jgi:hypothetical protein